ncbi:hypothetical protein CEXT_49141 [Caerostris extrusa]|uniref:Uncharacterized protein n=1 Tax=Caerostris extrusa TaxID=172846 RepID=A0AAV4XYQ4_CAEEX|nr:hypothetical protein CEXT_49141 [Caerostris extrusa]
MVFLNFRKTLIGDIRLPVVFSGSSSPQGDRLAVDGVFARKTQLKSAVEKVCLSENTSDYFHQIYVKSWSSNRLSIVKE